MLSQWFLEKHDKIAGTQWLGKSKKPGALWIEVMMMMLMILVTFTANKSVPKVFHGSTKIISFDVCRKIPWVSSAIPPFSMIKKHVPLFLPLVRHLLLCCALWGGLIVFRDLVWQGYIECHMEKLADVQMFVLTAQHSSKSLPKHTPIFSEISWSHLHNARGYMNKVLTKTKHLEFTATCRRLSAMSKSP